MKKVLSLLLAFATVMGVSVSAFAADVQNNLTSGLSGTRLSVDDNEIVLVEDNAAADVIMPETNLEPGTDYKFRLYTAVGQQINKTADELVLTPLTDIMLGGGKLRLRGQKGTSTINTAKIVKRGSGNTATYRLDITTKDNWGTKLTDVEYLISVTGQTSATAVAINEGRVYFQVGHQQFTDEDIDSYSEGDVITISNDAPVIMKEQFETLAKAYNYKAIEFEAEDGSWTFLGRVSGMGDTNFTYSRNVVGSIVDKLPDQDFEFLTFGSTVKFPANGEMRIDVSEFSDEFDRMYTYMYRDGKLTPVSTTYDTGADELVFRTNFLGSFVISDEQVTDTTIIDNGTTDGNAVEPGEDNEPNGTGNGIDNPGTGASSGLNIAVILGVASIAAAGISRKRK